MGKKKNSLRTDLKNAGSKVVKNAQQLEEEKQISIFMQEIKQSIRQFRLGHGWNQLEMAEKMGIGVNQQDVSKIESVEGGLSASQLYKLKALGVPVDRFFTEGGVNIDAGSIALANAKELWNGGMRAVFTTRSQGLKALIPNIRREQLGIHIVGSSLKGMTMDRLFLDAIEQRIKAGVELKILIGHPAFAGLRAWVEGRKAEGIVLEIEEAISNYCDHFQKLALRKRQDQVQIRVAIHPPTIFCVFLMSQRRALLNPYTLTIEAYNTPSFLVAGTQQNNGVFNQYYLHHFDDAWNSARLGREVSIDLNDKRMESEQLKQAISNFKKALESVVEKPPGYDKVP